MVGMKTWCEGQAGSGRNARRAWLTYVRVDRSTAVCSPTPPSRARWHAALKPLRLKLYTYAIEAHIVHIKYDQTKIRDSRVQWFNYDRIVLNVCTFVRQKCREGDSVTFVDNLNISVTAFKCCIFVRSNLCVSPDSNQGTNIRCKVEF